MLLAAAIATGGRGLGRLEVSLEAAALALALRLGAVAAELVGASGRAATHGRALPTGALLLMHALGAAVVLEPPLHHLASDHALGAALLLAAAEGLGAALTAARAGPVSGSEAAVRAVLPHAAHAGAARPAHAATVHATHAGATLTTAPLEAALRASGAGVAALPTVATEVVTLGPGAVGAGLAGGLALALLVPLGLLDAAVAIVAPVALVCTVALVAALHEALDAFAGLRGCVSELDLDLTLTAAGGAALGGAVLIRPCVALTPLGAFADGGTGGGAVVVAHFALGAGVGGAIGRTCRALGAGLSQPLGGAGREGYCNNTDTE